MNPGNERPTARGPAAPAARDQPQLSPHRQSPQVSILTGGGDKPYALGLAATLIAQKVTFDFIGSDELNVLELRQNPLIRFLNLRGDQRPDAPLARKVWRLLSYYARLIRYAATAKPRVFHLLWNNKLEFFDRTLLLLYYRLLGKRLTFTVHNVNAAVRDGKDSAFNRLTLRIQYRLVDHLFVHTEKMRQELRAGFGVPDAKISVIPFGINNSVSNTVLTTAEARQRLGLADKEKAVLFFGNIAPYKGLEFLVEAMGLIAPTGPEYRLLIVGRPKDCAPYWQDIRGRIARTGLQPFLIERIEFVPDEETEVFFKAADVLVLPYTHIYQSGVLALGYNFGLPVIASDVGSLREDIIEGKTGLLCRPQDPGDLARAIKSYFGSELYEDLAARRNDIRAYANERFSWTKVGEITRKVYAGLLGEDCPARGRNPGPAPQPSAGTRP